ncbi:MAG: flagellar motor switch protein FliG, partial [Clostridia bacterium]|nr:flagellar motor switch protein FliG [Clostridia bacterium]
MLKELRPKQKAAVLLVAMGPELSAQVFRHLRDDEIEQLTLELANLRQVDPEERRQVLEECRLIVEADRFVQQGGIQYARDVLERALGPQKAAEILSRLTATLQVRPFDFLRQADPAQVLSFVQSEHPQIVALVLAYLDPEQAALVLSALPPERQADVARRIAVMDTTSPDVVRDVERVFERRFALLGAGGLASAGGIGAIVEILNRVDRQTERFILENLGNEDPDLAEEIKRRMFVFEDIVLLDDRAVQRLLREVDLNNDLPLALKAASEDVREKVFRNLSQRAAENLRESMEYLGAVRLRDAEEAQQRIVAVVRRLEEQGEITVVRGG